MNIIKLMPNKHFLRLSIGYLTLIFLIIFTFPQIAIAQTLVWTKSNGIGSYSQEIRIAPSNPSVIYATLRGQDSGLYKSTDGGINFSIVFPFPNDDVNSIAISSSNSEKLCIGAYFTGIYCSVDGGTNFSNAGWTSSGLLGIKVRFITADPVDDSVFYAGTGEWGNGGIYKSTNSGTTWSQIGISTYGSQNSLNILVDLANHNRIFAGGDTNLYRSTDFGVNWIAVFTGHTNSPATLVDQIDSQVVYTGVDHQGVYKSIHGGDSGTWSPMNTGIESAFIFRLAQDSNNHLFGSRRNLPGSVWRSENGGESWENVGDPIWETRNAWGLDVKNGRILVSIEGLGIYIANTDGSPINPPPPPPPPGPNPVVVIPGFGGSWSDKAIIFHQTTDYHDWTIMPYKAPGMYNPFLDVLTNDGLQKDQNSFFFAYDFTRPVMDTAGWLNNFLTNEVLPKNPGKKVDIVAHSMGGLLARTCFESVDGCKNKINKIVSAGTPHRGAVDDYGFWEGADLSSLDLLSRFGAKLLLHFDGFPKWNEVRIIQEKVLGAKDFLPIFDYILGKPLWSLSPLAQNQFLSDLPTSFASQTLALSGNKPNSTTSYLTVSSPNKKELANGYWLDGKPKTLAKDFGDGTVLNSSSSLFGAQNKSYNINHDGYLNTLTPVNDILQFLELPQISALPATNVVSSATIYYSSSPDTTINVESATGETISQSSPSVVFVLNSKPQKRSLVVSAKKDGNYKIKAWHSDDQGKDIDGKPINIKLSAGEKKKIEVEFE